MKQLAIPLGRQKTTTKWLVIRRRPESSQLTNPRVAGQKQGFARYAIHYVRWIPACAGMTLRRGSAEEPSTTMPSRQYYDLRYTLAEGVLIREELEGK